MNLNRLNVKLLTTVILSLLLLLVIYWIWQTGSEGRHSGRQWQEVNGNLNAMLQTSPAPSAAIRETPKAVSKSPANPAQSTAAPGKININSAAADQLQSLPGIGPSKARAIVEYRQHKGAFKRVEEIMKVKGIGPKTFEKLKPLIAVEDKESIDAPQSLNQTK